jgi:hypothetical protein
VIEENLKNARPLFDFSPVHNVNSNFENSIWIKKTVFHYSLENITIGNLYTSFGTPCITMIDRAREVSRE